MSKYKEETYIYITDTSKGWTKNIFGSKFYRKDNWIIANYKDFGINYWIIDESYEYGYYLTGDKQEFLEEKRKLEYKKGDTMKKLKLKLIKYKDTVLIVEILHQCESLRSSGGLRIIYKNSEFELKSHLEPQMSCDTLWVKGTVKRNDNITPANSYSTKEKRDKMHDFIIEAVKHINGDTQKKESDDDFQVTIVD